LIVIASDLIRALRKVYEILPLRVIFNPNSLVTSLIMQKLPRGKRFEESNA
jgi:hypothetical protein